MCGVGWGVGWGGGGEKGRMRWVGVWWGVQACGGVHGCECVSLTKPVSLSV